MPDCCLMCFSTVLVLISDMPLYLWLVWFGTRFNFWICPCTHSHFCSALVPLSRISPVLTATSVRHSYHFPESHLYSWPLLFGTRATFPNITCTHSHFGSALLLISEYSPVLTATSVRHSCHFPEYHLYSWPLWFGTRATFRNITCTLPPSGSALVPLSRISPVLMATLVRHGCSFLDIPLYSQPLLVRHGCSFPNIPLYPYPILFGTRAIFQNLTCTHDDFVRHWLSFSDMPCTLQLR